MAVTFNTSSASNTGAATNTVLNITLPTWTVAGGDFILIILASSVGGGVAATDPTANGYTLVGQVRNTNGATIAMWGKRAVPADSGSTTGITYLSTQFMTLQAHVYSGAGGIGTFVLNPTTNSAVASATTGVLSALTPTQGSGILVGAIDGRGGSVLPVITQSTPASWTNQLISSTALVSGNNCSLNVWNLTGYGTGSSAGNSTFGATQFFASMVVEVLPLAAPIQSVAPARRRPFLRALTVRATKPPQPQPTPPPKFSVPRRTPRSLRRRSSVAWVPLKQTVLNPTYVPVVPPRRFLRLIRGRGTASMVPLTQIAAPPPTYVPVMPARRNLRAILRRSFGAVPVPAQVAVPPPTFVPQAPPRRRLAVVLRRRSTGVPLAQALPPSVSRLPRRKYTGPRRRGRSPGPLTPQVTVPNPPFVSGMPTRRTLRLFRRGPLVALVPVAQTGPSRAAPERTTRVRPVARTRVSTPPMAQVQVQAPQWVPVQIPRRGIRRILRRTTTAVPVPVQVAVPAPPFVQATPAKRSLRSLIRRAVVGFVQPNAPQPILVPTGYLVDLTEVIHMTRMWNITRGYSAWRIAGVWYFGHTPDDSQLAGHDYYLRGGYEGNVVDVTAGLQLQALGVSVTPIYT